jgi:hypothetical protein
LLLLDLDPKVSLLILRRVSISVPLTLRECIKLIKWLLCLTLVWESF